jgi:membrane associated rhomboid family serine protease
LLPLKDNVPTPGVPVLTLALILASVCLYVVDWQPDLADLAWPWAVAASLLLSASLLGLVVNMLFLWLFGESLENALGWWRFLGLLALGGFGAAGAQELAQPDTVVPSVGIAGCIAALIGAYAILLPRGRILCWVLIPFFVTFVEIPAFFLAAAWFALQALDAVGQPPLAGLVAGLVLGMAGGWLLGRGRIAAALAEAQQAVA